MSYANTLSTLWHCLTCHYQWWAPKAERCPKCHEINLEKLHEQKLDYVRL